MWEDLRLGIYNDPTPKTEAAVRSSLLEVIDSPIAERDRAD